MRSTRGRALLVTALVGTLLLSIATVHLAARARGAEAGRCETHAADAAWRASQVTGAGRRVVVVGDSYSVGLGLARPAASWPAWIPGRVHVAGFSGSGWSVHASPCAGTSFAERAHVALRGGADLVLVGTGLNDVDQSDQAITAGFTRLLSRVGHGRLVVVGPPSAPARSLGVPRVDALLADLARSHGVAYVGTADLELTYLGDGLHLTAEGHRDFGEAVAERVAAALS